MAKSRKPVVPSGRSLSAKLGWVTRRARAEGKDPERAKRGFLGYLGRIAREDARAKGRGRVPPGASKARILPDGKRAVYLAPRDADNSISAQPALLDGGVVADMIGRVGAKVSRSSALGVYAGLTGLVRVHASFVITDVERSRTWTESHSRVETLRAGSSLRDRELVVARAVRDMVHGLLKRNSLWDVRLLSIDANAESGGRKTRKLNRGNRKVVRRDKPPKRARRVK